MNSLTKALGVGALILSSLLSPQARAQISVNSDNSSNSNNSNNSNADSLYYLALAAENHFRSERDTAYAFIAIDNYERHYSSNPNGRYSCSALLKKASLLHKLGRDDDAQAELKRAKENSRCKDLYANLVKYMENMIKRRENNLNNRSKHSTQ